MTAPHSLAPLINGYAAPGAVRWIGIRPARKADLNSRSQADIIDSGIVGDHRSKPGKRAVTLIQWEHLAVIASLTGNEAVDPALLRRNLAVSGINLLGLRNREFRVGNAILLGTGLCAPCSRMEEALGHGGYGAVRGHGGITASVVEAGTIYLGDPVFPVE